MSRVVIVKWDKPDKDLLSEVITKYPNQRKIWFIDKKSDFILNNGLRIYTHPWSVEKFLYTTLAYLVYMHDLKTPIVFCTTDFLDGILLSLMNNISFFYKNKEYRKMDSLLKSLSYGEVQRAREE